MQLFTQMTNKCFSKAIREVEDVVYATVIVTRDKIHLLLSELIIFCCIWQCALDNEIKTDVSDGNKTATIRVVRYNMTVLYWRSQCCGNVHDAEFTMWAMALALAQSLPLTWWLFIWNKCRKCEVSLTALKQLQKPPNWNQLEIINY